jgi:cystathionine beta-lyase/cystathionine gamma-synthase
VDFETLFVHLGEEKNPHGAIVPPIYQNSLFACDTLAQFQEAARFDCVGTNQYYYSRISNPTVSLAEQKIAALEGTEAAMLFSSGMAAISTALQYGVITRPNDADEWNERLQGGVDEVRPKPIDRHADPKPNLVYVDAVYGPSRCFIEEVIEPMGVEARMVSGECLNELRDAIDPGTRCVLLESPTSLTFKLQDLRGVAELARKHNAWTMIDNTCATPFYQRPHELGIDLVLHSATKYMAGHSDLVAGVICGRQNVLRHLMRRVGQFSGGRLMPLGAWLLLRGLRTMKLRVMHAAETGRVMSEALHGMPQFQYVLDAMNPENMRHGYAAQQMTGAGSLMSVVPHSQDIEPIRQFVESLKLFRIGVSWGGHESLVVPLQVPRHMLPGWAVMPHHGPHDKVWLIRFYGGLENVQDLVEDIRQAAVHLGVR